MSTKFQNSAICLFFCISLIVINGCKKEKEYTLKVNIFPEGAGTVDVSPGGGAYSSGMEVTLNPNPNTDYGFVKWSGTDVSLVNSNKIVMSKDIEITANFGVINVANGTWTGHYLINGKGDDIQFNIKNNAISIDGSTLAYTGISYSLIYTIYLPSVSMTSYAPVEIPITQAKFIHIYESAASLGEKTTITGTFSSPTKCAGKVKYERDSWNVASFDFEASPE